MFWTVGGNQSSWSFLHREITPDKSSWGLNQGRSCSMMTVFLTQCTVRFQWKGSADECCLVFSQNQWDCSSMYGQKCCWWRSAAINLYLQHENKAKWFKAEWCNIKPGVQRISQLIISVYMPERLMVPIWNVASQLLWSGIFYSCIMGSQR